MAIPFGSPSFTIRAAELAPPLPRIVQSTSICKAAATNKWTTALNHLITDNSNSSPTFHEYYSNVEELSIKHTEKIMNVRHMLEAEEGKQPLKCMVMVDALQRLGIDYHFQEQIQAQLSRLHDLTTVRQNSIYESQALDQVSLYFRLLRQEGFYVHAADTFNNFKNKEGKFIFKKTAMKDMIRSLSELYEASQLRIEGEYILDEAENISSQLLRKWVTTKIIDNDKAVIIANTLKHPYRKSLARFETGNLLSYKFAASSDIINCNFWENTFQELSIVDSFISRSTHRSELRKISKWWTDVDLTKELKFARDQPLKWFAWPMGILPDLRLSDERIELTKSVSLIYILDDIFDLYGTLEELTLFTDAVNRWELDAVEKLPNYMKTSFRVLYDITNETVEFIAKKHGSVNIPDVSLSLRKAWASLCNAYLVEAKWLASKETPKAEEYLKNGIVTSGVHVTLVHLFFLLGLGSKFLLRDISGIVSSVATILRLWNDLGSSKDDGEHGHDYSYINYYMKEGVVVSVEMSREHVIQRICDEWKRLNKECLSLNQSLASFQKGAINIARMVPLMYDYDHHRTLPYLGQYMRSMFYDHKAGHVWDDDPFNLLG